MISYLIKSGLCLAILLAFYHLVLEREKMHQFNRFYLLGSVLFSFIVPFFIIYVEAAPEMVADYTEIAIPKSHEILLPAEVPVDNSINFTQYFVMFYLFVSSILLVRFLKSFVDIILKIKTNQTVHYKSAKVVLVEDAILPHTFWNYIFINKEEFFAKKIETELFTHELTHVTQKHTLDVLIIEFLQIVLWFNPFFYPLKKAIQLNHEFLADDKVIASHQDITRYQYLLLDKAAWKNKYYLASNLNYSLTKKRLLMMKTPNSRATIFMKKLAILPLLTGLVFLFADRVEAQSKKKKPQVIEVKEQKRKATKAQMDEYKALLERSLKDKVFNLKELRKMRLLYSMMSKAQKKTVKNVNELVPPPPPRELTKRQISSKKYEELKDKKKYAVWIDSKPVDNSVLNKYKHTDFKSYSGSYVYNNARSKKFPQEHQYSLYTEEYVEEYNKKVRAQKNKPPKPVKIEVVKKGEKSKIPPPPPPRKQKEPKESKAAKVAKRLKELKESKEVAETREIIEETEVPVELVEIREVPEGVEEVEEVIEDEPALRETVIEANEIREEIVEEPEVIEVVETPLAIQETVKFNKGWYITIDGQRYYYTFDRVERVARYYKNGKLVDLDIVKEYKKKHKIYKQLQKEGKHFVHKSKQDKRRIKQEFSDLGGMYFRMSRDQKRRVSRPKNPIAPYLRLITEQGKVYYKLRSELTDEDRKNIPPPPPEIMGDKMSDAEKAKARKAYKEWSKRLKLIEKEG